VMTVRSDSSTCGGRETAAFGWGLGRMNAVALPRTV
jgi:hypothetical protein